MIEKAKAWGCEHNNSNAPFHHFQRCGFYPDKLRTKPRQMNRQKGCLTTVYRALAEKHNVPLASVAIAFGLWPTAVTHAVIGWSVRTRKLRHDCLRMSVE